MTDKKLSFFLGFSILISTISSTPCFSSYRPTHYSKTTVSAMTAALIGFYAAYIIKISEPHYRKTLHWNWNCELANASLDFNWNNQSISLKTLKPHHLAGTFRSRDQKIKRQTKKSDYETPLPFLWGAGTSSHQVEGNCINNTHHLWEQAKKDDPSYPTITEEAGIACDHLNRYKSDLRLVKDAGCNSYRLSVEWSKIEPEEGIFDQNVLNEYVSLLEEAKKHNICIMLVLHHYTEPIWFALKGGFEKEENINCFVKFCEKVFEQLHSYVDLWVTFNAPEAHASRVYLTHVAPPGNFACLDSTLIQNYKDTNEKKYLIEALKKYQPKKRHIQTATQVTKNMLIGHVRIYRTLKEKNETARIGIMKNIHQVDPWNRWNPLDQLASYVNQNLNDESVFNFFSTGIFKVYIPIPWFGAWINVEHYEEGAKGALDFIGLNYYSHRFMSNLQKQPHPSEEDTDNENYSIYAEGLYRGIQTIYERIIKPNNRSIPIYITENGIATDDDELREIFLKKYLYTVAKAIKNGYPINGYIHWSLMDNYEWGSYDKHYGIYHVNRKNNLKRTLKFGSNFLINLAKASQF